MELPPGLFRVQISNGAAVLVSFDLSAKLLRDAIDAIPDAGFVTNPSERRHALENKSKALENMLHTLNLMEAQMALTHDIKPTLQRWLKDDYPIGSPLEVSKSEILALVDEVILRVSSKR